MHSLAEIFFFDPQIKQYTWNLNWKIPILLTGVVRVTLVIQDFNSWVQWKHKSYLIFNFNFFCNIRKLLHFVYPKFVHPALLYTKLWNHKDITRFEFLCWIWFRINEEYFFFNKTQTSSLLPCVLEIYNDSHF